MTEIEQKALALVNEVRDERGFRLNVEMQREDMAQEALCRAIEQHEAFRQEVSEIVEQYVKYVTASTKNGAREWERLKGLIIAKPDPLVEAVKEASNPDYDCASPEAYAEVLRAALAKHGLKLERIEHD